MPRYETINGKCEKIVSANPETDYRAEDHKQKIKAYEQALEEYWQKQPGSTWRLNNDNISNTQIIKNETNIDNVFSSQNNNSKTSKNIGIDDLLKKSEEQLNKYKKNRDKDLARFEARLNGNTKEDELKEQNELKQNQYKEQNNNQKNTNQNTTRFSNIELLQRYYDAKENEINAEIKLHASLKAKNPNYNPTYSLSKTLQQVMKNDYLKQKVEKEFDNQLKSYAKTLVDKPYNVLNSNLYYSKTLNQQQNYQNAIQILQLYNNTNQQTINAVPLIFIPVGYIGYRR